MKICKDNNLTSVTELFLLGFHINKNVRLLLLSVLLFVICGTICGNLLIIALVSTSKTLHTPMYFFISQLSISDILLTTDIAPLMLHILLRNGALITFKDCVTQYFFFCTSEIFESLLLTVMSYDRYVAICNPLHYSSIMTSGHCVRLITICWFSGLSIAATGTLTLLIVTFCGGKNIIDHFFCDLVPLLEIAYSSTYLVELEVTVVGPPLLCIPVLFIMISYTKIMNSILRLASNISREKAFSTCSSHLVVVSIFYLSLFSVYVIPTKGQTVSMSKILSLLYTVFTPFINPIIYSLRNKDIRKAVQNLPWLLTLLP